MRSIPSCLAASVVVVSLAAGCASSQSGEDVVSDRTVVDGVAVDVPTFDARPEDTSASTDAASGDSADDAIVSDARTVDSAIADAAIADSGTSDSGSAFSCSRITPPAGFVEERFAGFESLRTVQFGTRVMCMPFPETGGPLCVLAPRRTAYAVVRFVVPMPAPGGGARFQWSESQYTTTNGEYGSVESLTAHLSGTISTCPGDFRDPPPMGSAAPPGDPTYVNGCRSIRRTATGLFYTRGFSIRYSGVSDDANCVLQPGQTYYFNFVAADPTDGFVVGEGCGADTPRCGVQLSVANTL